MADAPRGGGAPEEGTPEYDWLYGGDSSGSDETRVMRPGAEAGAPDDTKMMPASDPDPAPTRGGRGGRPPAGPMTATHTPPPPRHPESPTASRRRRHPLRWIATLLLLWLVYLIAVPFWAVSTTSQVDAFPGGGRPDDGAGTNYLIVGSDKADDLTKQQQEDLRTGPRGGTNTDTIMILHTGAGPDTMMSIPRDTLVEVPGHGTQMINAAFSLGKAPLLVESVERLTGIHVDHYVELGFGSVINTVDALGGIEICPKQDMKDPAARLNVTKGCQEVDGETALAYSRSRHVFELSDLNRVGQQQEVIGAIGDKVLSPWTFVNPVRYWRLNMAAADAIRIDEEMGVFDLGRFALAMTGSHQTCTLPNLPAPSDPNRLVTDEARAKPLFKAIIDGTDIPARSCTSTGRER